MADRSVFDRIRARGEEAFAQVSNDLLANPRFLSAMQTAMRGKEAVDEAVGSALRAMNLPTRTEFSRVMTRLEVLESEIKDLRTQAQRHSAKRGGAGATVVATRRSAPPRPAAAKGGKKAGRTSRRVKPVPLPD